VLLDPSFDRCCRFRFVGTHDCDCKGCYERTISELIDFDASPELLVLVADELHRFFVCYEALIDANGERLIYDFASVTKPSGQSGGT